MRVYWFEQNQTDVPDDHNWLNAREADVLRGIHFPKRRADWLLGRWTAKNALAISLSLSTESEGLREIEIRATDSGAPEALLRNQLASVSFSLSHRSGIAACAIAPSDVLLGCDLEMIEPRSNAFVEDYFAAEERTLVESQLVANRDALLAVLWSAKESTLKAIREGLRRDTRSVVVSFPSLPAVRNQLQESSAEQSSLSASFLRENTCWDEIHVRSSTGEIFRGWWTESCKLVRTLVAAPPPDRPVLLCKDCNLAI